jgi:hypothetical protein
MKRRSGQVVAVMNGGVAVALVALVASLALIVAPPAPPGIAEFAPQAAKPISKAPLGQASTSGQGPGSCAQGMSCTAAGQRRHHPLPSPKTPARSAGNLTGGVPSALQCYSWPNGAVTQTFDPQSPPCVASWPGAAKGNGGRTASGVDSSTIRIAIPELASSTNDPTVAPDLERFFNSRFEFYGRKLQLITPKYPPYGTSTYDPQVVAATARDVCSQEHVFASTELNTQGDQALYRDTLAGCRVLSVTESDPTSDSREFARHAPYEWSYGPTADTTETMAGRFACTALVGKRASYSTTTSSRIRSFAVFVEDDPTVASAPLVNALASCGVTARIEHFSNPDSGNGRNCDSAPPPALIQQMLALKGAVTTILPLENELRGTSCLQAAAAAVSYQPEWLIPQTAGNQLDAMNGTEMAGTLGLLTLNRPLASLAEFPSYQAVTAVDPSYGTPDRVWFLESLYHQLLLLASGIQAAGPNLTPATFQAGLQSLTFPNPGAAGAPSWQATVGFPPGEHTMIRDLGLWWWDNTRGSPGDSWNTAYQNHQTQGGRCFVALGRRWQINWPANPTLQSGPCR